MVPADVTGHAGSVEGFGTSVTAAGKAGAGVDLGIETYGILCQAFSVYARLQIAETGDAISQVGSALPGIADALRDCADSTTETDDDHAALFDQIKGG